MNCKEAILLMHDYLDGDLTGPEAAELKKHLIGCASCQERYTKLEKTGAALMASMKPVHVPSHLTTASIMQKLPAPAKRTVWMRWPRRHPAATVAALFCIVMLGSFMSMWNEDTQLVVHGSNLEQVVIKGNTVVVPEGQTYQGNLIVENGKIEVNGKIDGNLIVIDGNYALASTAQISGDITSVNQAAEWVWYKLNQLFTLFVK
ncbi:zf-HC2 domain-containing protein [Paenibacillus ginsengarvi]|uniref:Anti-sigma-W factor RsiW n=1 Tax=Paenibacillus ginsengarvi TaxID=400777 RepID=A0A3B0C145_9BACL|nr:zf-HC2 domain-containing protein [Paenibacillus ginsengarvi]RKN78308.1 anti-sigma factor [Paenibacillus ginsengarvi]